MIQSLFWSVEGLLTFLESGSGPYGCLYEWMEGKEIAVLLPDVILSSGYGTLKHFQESYGENILCHEKYSHVNYILKRFPRINIFFPFPFFFFFKSTRFKILCHRTLCGILFLMNFHFHFCLGSLFFNCFARNHNFSRKSDTLMVSF